MLIRKNKSDLFRRDEVERRDHLWRHPSHHWLTDGDASLIDVRRGKVSHIEIKQAFETMKETQWWEAWESVTVGVPYFVQRCFESEKFHIEIPRWSWSEQSPRLGGRRTLAPRHLLLPFFHETGYIPFCGDGVPEWLGGKERRLVLWEKLENYEEKVTWESQLRFLVPLLRGLVVTRETSPALLTFLAALLGRLHRKPSELWARVQDLHALLGGHLALDFDAVANIVKYMPYSGDMRNYTT